jgi:threonine aldolase
MIDFRSDTVTKPTVEMQEAMASAPLGDDVFQDDPSINALEEKAARMFGHEAALFCPSGTMTNQIAIKVHTQPGDEVVCDQLAHIYNYEGGGIAFNSSASVRLLRGDKGRFTENDVLESILPDDVHHPKTRLVAAENTCNKGGGSIWEAAELKKIKTLCDNHELAFHLDGARLFNALVETGESAHSVGETFDSISICLSKGLGCPVGSLLIGNSAFIKQSRRVRKVFGGGMRQAGMLAAAGTYALDHHIDRLKNDHKMAKYLALQLEQAKWVEKVIEPETNIVIALLKSDADQEQLLHKMRERNILAVGFGKGKIRFVTHLDVSEAQLMQAAETLVKL